MKIRSSIAAVAALAALALACASSQKPLPNVEKTQTVTATATVKSVDLATRKVTLVQEDGRPYTFVAGPEVRNLAQLKPGDTVKATYTESLAVTVKRNDGSVPTAGATATLDRAAPGEKPGGTATAMVSASATIIAIDRSSNRVTLQGPEGNFRVLQVQDPKNLEGVQVGDMVYATYTESVGIQVEPVPAAQPAAAPQREPVK